MRSAVPQAHVSWGGRGGGGGEKDSKILYLGT